jgi:hypothetical protein
LKRFDLFGDEELKEKGRKKYCADPDENVMVLRTTAKPYGLVL